MCILLISHGDDPATDWVESWLVGRGADVLRFDTEFFPWEFKLTYEQTGSHSSFQIVHPSGRRLDASIIAAVWYRREAQPLLPSTISLQERESAERESRDFLDCFYYWLEGKPWVNPLPSIVRAECKTLQLKLANQCGLAIPATLITNAPESAKAFCAKPKRRVVVKMLSPVSITSGKEEMSVFTSDLSESDLIELDGLRFAPMTFQVKVQKQYDIRVTIVGQKIFAVRIDSQVVREARTDWRLMHAPASHCSSIVIPPQILACLHSFMHLIGLRYGCIDMVLTQTGEFVFLEVNACGDWGWLPDNMCSEIAEAICDLLLEDSNSKK